MTREEFETAVREVRELWPGQVFFKKWNVPNQMVAFKKFSTFRLDELLDALSNHRYDNPDAREPKFSEIAAKLWAVRKTREGKKDSEGESPLPPWPVILAWSERKSDGDLDHLWQVVTQRYQSAADAHDKLWHFLNCCDRRSGACLSIAWAVEHDVALTFKRGSDEWHAAYGEYDKQQWAKSVEEYAGRSKPSVPKLEPYPQEARRA